jgi:hypothetical protein
MTTQPNSSLGLLRLLLLSGAILAGLAIVGVIAWQHLTDAETVTAGIANMRPWLATWRLLLLVSLIGLWPRLVNALAERYKWTEVQRQRVSVQRWRVATWLIVIELVLVQNVIGKFVHVLAS